MFSISFFLFFFFFNDTATTEIYTLSLHDALPISYYAVNDFDKTIAAMRKELVGNPKDPQARHLLALAQDRKSTRLNSSHLVISYAVFCLKKKKNTTQELTHGIHVV